MTGQKIAEKIRDLRLRKSLTGKTSLPRLHRKTNPKQIEAEQVDFEEEAARYKSDIAKDIQQLKQQSYKEPAWITKIIDRDMKQAQRTGPRPSTSSSSWEQPISDTQAVELSNYILTSEEEQAFFTGEDCAINSQASKQDAQIEDAQASEEAPPGREQDSGSGNQDTQLTTPQTQWCKDDTTDTWY